MVEFGVSTRDGWEKHEATNATKLWKTHKFTRVSKFSEDVTSSVGFLFWLPGGGSRFHWFFPKLRTSSCWNTLEYAQLSSLRFLDHVSCMDAHPIPFGIYLIIFQFLHGRAPPILQPAQLQYLHLSCDLVPSFRDSTKCHHGSPRTCCCLSCWLTFLENGYFL